MNDKDRYIYYLDVWKDNERRTLRTRGGLARVEHVMYSRRVQRTLLAMGYTEWFKRGEAVHHV